MRLFRTGMVVALVAAVCFVSTHTGNTATAGEAKVKTLLLVGGSVHDWKGVGDVVEKTLSESNEFAVTRVNNDLDAFLAAEVAPYKLIVFYWTLGELTPEQKRGILDHVKAGAGLVTFHSGADSFRDDRQWHELVGGHFITHPSYRQYQVSITEVPSPITEGISEFMTTDEQYILDYDRDNITVLGNGLYKGKLMPAIWVKAYGNGRVFYNSGGHDKKAVEQPMFKKLLLRGCQWATSER